MNKADRIREMLLADELDITVEKLREMKEKEPQKYLEMLLELELEEDDEV